MHHALTKILPCCQRMFIDISQRLRAILAFVEEGSLNQSSTGQRLAVRQVTNVFQNADVAPMLFLLTD